MSEVPRLPPDVALALLSLAPAPAPRMKKSWRDALTVNDPAFEPGATPGTYGAIRADYLEALCRPLENKDA